MKKKTIKLLIGFIILFAVLISAGCNESRQQDDNTNSDNNQNTNVNSNTDSNPEDEKVVDAIFEKMKDDPNLRDQVKNVKITYSNKTITLSGFIYGEESLLAFHKILFDVKVPESSRKDSAKFMQSNNSTSEDEAVEKIMSDDFHWYRQEVDRQCSGTKCECGGSCVSCASGC